MKKITRHLVHFIPLYGILIASIAGVYIFSYDKSFQLASASAGAAGYFVWGIVHHYIHEDLSWEIVFEYAAISVLGLVIVYSLLSS